MEIEHSNSLPPPSTTLSSLLSGNPSHCQSTNPTLRHVCSNWPILIRAHEILLTLWVFAVSRWHIHDGQGMTGLTACPWRDLPCGLYRAACRGWSWSCNNYLFLPFSLICFMLFAYLYHAVIFYLYSSGMICVCPVCKVPLRYSVEKGTI